MPIRLFAHLTRAAHAIGAHKEFSDDERKKLAKSGAAMPDGSFPIQSADDPENAIHALGRANNPAATKQHIIRRAKALGLTAKLPDGWKTSGQGTHSIGIAASDKHGAPEWIELIPAGEFGTRDGRGPYQNPDPTQVIKATAAEEENCAVGATNTDGAVSISRP